MTVAFTVDPGSLTVENYVHVLSGRRDPSIVAMTVNGVAGLVDFPTQTTWKVELILAAGLNEIKLRAQDNALVWTPEMVVQLTLPSYELRPHVYFNVLDEHGLELGLARNPGEKNWDYRTRLLKFASYYTGASLEGLFLAACVELGILPDPEALRVRIMRQGDGDLTSRYAYLEITSTDVYVDCPDMVQTREKHRVDPRTRSIILDYDFSTEAEIKVYNSNDDRVQPHRYQIDEVENTVTFADDDLNGEWVTVHYQYRYRIDRRTITMTQLKSELDSIVIGSTQLLEVEVSDGSLSALGLSCMGRHQLSYSWSNVPHGRIRVASLEDQKYQRSLLNQFGTAFNTKLERWARRTRAKSSMGWDELILDQGMWDVDGDKGAMDFLPRLFDAVFGRWYCTHPSCSTTYNLLEKRKNNGMCPIHNLPVEYLGITLPMIKSGVVESDSLYAISEAVEEEL